MTRIEVVDGNGMHAAGPAQPELLTEQCRELDSVREKLARLAADFKNYRRRTERQSAEHRDHGKAAVLADLIDLADDLERAMRAGEAEPGALREGVGGIYRRMRSILRKHAVEPIDSVGRPFDVELHEAVATVPANGVPPDCIADEQRRGYLFIGRLLRPAQVVVAVGPDSRDGRSAREEVGGNDGNNEGLL